MSTSAQNNKCRACVLNIRNKNVIINRNTVILLYSSAVVGSYIYFMFSIYVYFFTGAEKNRLFIELRCRCGRLRIDAEMSKKINVPNVTLF